jgi:hypothetical protein
MKPFNKYFLASLIGIFYFFSSINNTIAQSIKIKNDPKERSVAFGNEKITIKLDYNNKANISSFIINNGSAIQSDTGIYCLIKTKEAVYSTLHLLLQPSLKISSNKIILSGIKYGDDDLIINENWIFTVSKNNINFDIERSLSKNITAEKIGSPVFTFNDIKTWEGAYQDYGGLAWFYLFNKKLDTYGVHSSSSDLWNSKNENGITIAVSSPENKVAMDYTRGANDNLLYDVVVSPDDMLYRFDSVTNRRRYVRDTTDVWAPVKLYAGTTHQRIELSYFNFKEKYGRGNFKGIDQDQVSAVLNTVARIGVIDKDHFGANSWHTPYGPICLHEQYIAQLGLGINDPQYLKGYQQCLNFYRDNAIKPDGRVWPRWAYSNEDAMPQQFTDKGFYEAEWGYLLDANPDLVTNVVELYDQTGDLKWVKTQQPSCEKALEWIMKRDSNNNGLVEMITDSYKQKRGSDWIDIIWASYENAFVNAKLYHALILWSDIEKQLGNSVKEKQYKQFAEKLKQSFNKPTTEGGLWDEEKKCYIHWRDKDGSIHGNNMVTPVNFMAIAYGICDDKERIRSVLDEIEMQMQKEKLFFWPICLYSYAPGEGNDWQFPFPNYENGELFLSWGSVGVKAYASYKPELALQYVKNVLAQYEKDGLAFQRYGRTKQDGLGDDILAGNSLAIVGLYQSIYGINPMYNRFYLDPHTTPELAGTEIKYNYRGQKLIITLDSNKYAIANGQYKIFSKNNFGFFSTANELLYFSGNSNKASLKVTTAISDKLELEINKWDKDERSFTQTSRSDNKKFVYQINDVSANSYYTVLLNKKFLTRVKTNSVGYLKFEIRSDKKQNIIEMLNK